jgi:cyclic pyranopterin phosphate synthase
MPAEKVNFLPKNKILSYEELERLIRIFYEQGVRKIRFTGGEPFVRVDFIKFFEKISQEYPDISLHLTTNGTLTEKYIPKLEKLGLKSINISLDTLNKDKFSQITRRDEFEKVMSTIAAILKSKIRLKINAVIKQDINEDEIVSMVDYFKDFPLELRYIEHMPFDESPDHVLDWSGEKIIKKIQKKYKLKLIPREQNGTSQNFYLSEGSPEFRFGIIEGFTRSFCGSCNRIRLSAEGKLKTCLYADYKINLKHLIHEGLTDDELREKIYFTVTNRYETGKDAQLDRNRTTFESMSKIGG